jgi:hypothetical protein
MWGNRGMGIGKRMEGVVEWKGMGKEDSPGDKVINNKHLRGRDCGSRDDWAYRGRALGTSLTDSDELSEINVLAHFWL